MTALVEQELIDFYHKCTTSGKDICVLCGKRKTWRYCRKNEVFECRKCHYGHPPFGPKEAAAEAFALGRALWNHQAVWRDEVERKREQKEEQQRTEAS